MAEEKDMDKRKMNRFEWMHVRVEEGETRQNVLFIQMLSTLQYHSNLSQSRKICKFRSLVHCFPL